MWWAIASTAISAASAYGQKQSGDAQNDNQRLWNQYNAQSQFNVQSGNIMAQLAIAKGNAAMQIQAGKSNIDINDKRIEFNARQTMEVALYNDSLFDDELDMLWQQHDLDIALLGKQRERERGEMVAWQSASGTVIGEDSNADVIIDQMTQEQLDKLVVKHGADIGAKRISDARAKSLWDAGNELKKMQFEGAMFNIQTTANAAMGAAGTMMQANISGMADLQSAKYQLTSGMAGADTQWSSNNSKIQSNFRSSLYSTAANAGMSAYSGASASTTSVVNQSFPSSFGSNMAGSSLMRSGATPSAGMSTPWGGR